MENCNNNDGLAAALLAAGLNNRRSDDNGCDAAKVALNVAGYDGINHNINTSMIGLTNQLNQGFDNQNGHGIMAKLGTIEGSIPLTAAQVQLAIAGSTASVNQNIANGLTAAIVGQTGINKNISDAIATSLASQAAIKETVLASASANLTATLNSKFEISSTIRDDGDKTRALLVAQNEANLNRLLTVADLDRRDERSSGRSREVEVNVTQSVTQTQLQLQAQQQQQQQTQLLTQLCAVVGGLQNAVATNSNLIVGNSGPTTTGPQAANPVNVRT